MLKMFRRVRHQQYGQWLAIMRQNPTAPALGGHWIVTLPPRSGWPEYVAYPPR